MCFEKAKATDSHGTDRRHDADERGFTLIEVVISMVILLIVVAGALSMLALSITYSTGAVGNGLLAVVLGVVEK